LQASAIEKYHHGHGFVVNDVAASDLTDCHKRLLERFQVKANCAVPILFSDQNNQINYLWGLLIAHQCGSPRRWYPDDVHFLQRLSVQLAIAIQQAELYQSLQQLNDELLQTNLELRQATRLKDEFLANMSHELRTPLTAILGMAELMLGGTYNKLNADQAKATNTISHSAQHLMGLINEILDLAKIESGKMSLEPEPCNPVSLCEDCLQLVRSQANKKSISLQLQTMATVNQVELDSRRLRQALINLLSNAVKFTPNGGSVKLQMERVGAWLNFHVIDTGIGIDPGDRHKLFQPFTQLDSQYNRQYEGTGLGLALVKRIAELHQGTISFTSVPHQGSHFTLAIPYKPISEISQSPAVPEKNENHSHPSVADPKTVRLLIADDDPNMVAALQDYLSARGYELCFADNGVTAINQIYQEHPDLVIVDIQMPVMNGWDTITHIRRDPTLGTLPIIVVTASAMPQEREQCLAAGATTYISKPVRLSALERLIRETLAEPMQSLPCQTDVVH
jgi:signal transduction histidine kinase/CheY-like chemotaxis protein